MVPSTLTRLHLALTVNGERVEAAVDPAKTLLEVLREDLQLTGTKHGCELGECGACAVLLDGEPVLSCLVLAPECGGREVLTVEGLVHDGRLDPLQETFADLGGSQCGYCTPGILITARALLDREPHPSRERSARRCPGNLCRCTGYLQIVEAVEAAARLQRRATGRRRRPRGRHEHPDQPRRGGGQGPAPRRRPRQGHRPDPLRRRPVAAAHGALPAVALDGAARPHPVDRRVAGPGDGRRAPGAHRRRLPDRLRHPAGQPGRASALPRPGPLRRRSGGGGDRPRRADRDRGARPHRRRLRGAAHLRLARGEPGAPGAAHPRLRRRGQHPQEGVAAVRRRRRGARRRRPRLRRPLLLRGQHPPADRAARHGGGDRSRRQAGRLLEHADAALPAPRAGQGAGDAGGAHPRRRHAQRRRLRRQERSVQPRDRRRPRGAPARSAGEDLPDPRRGVPLPSRAAPGADALPHRRQQRRQHPGHAPADAARRRRLRLLRRGQHLLHRRAADRDLPDPDLPLRGLPGLHQQAAVRPQARPRHAAEPLRPGSAARQDRRAAEDRPGRSAPRA